MTLWRYDALRRDPLTARRIPVTSMRPLHSYLLAVHKESRHRPTEREVKILIEFIEEKKQRVFTAEERRLMGSCPFDTHPGVTTVVVHKYAPDDWGYRLASWPTSVFTPTSPKTERTIGPWPLVELLDRINEGSERQFTSWTAWKNGHPEVFV
jgi:hypothetical protein